LRQAELESLLAVAEEEADETWRHEFSKANCDTTFSHIPFPNFHIRHSFVVGQAATVRKLQARWIQGGSKVTLSPGRS